MPTSPKWTDLGAADELAQKPFQRVAEDVVYFRYFKNASRMCVKAFNIIISYLDARSEDIFIGEKMQVGVFLRRPKYFYNFRTLGPTLIGYCQLHEIENMFQEISKLLDGSNKTINFKLGQLTFVIALKSHFTPDGKSDHSDLSESSTFKSSFKITGHNGLFPCVWDNTNCEIMKSAVEQFNSSMLFRERTAGIL